MYVRWTQHLATGGYKRRGRDGKAGLHVYEFQPAARMNHIGFQIVPALDVIRRSIELA